MGRLIIVTELFYPEETSTAYILTKIANKLSEKKEVLVICGPELYGDKREKNINSMPLNDSVTIKRVSGVKLDKNRLLLRLIRFIIISLRLFISTCKNMREGDTIFVVTNPAPLLLLISLIKTSKNPFLILVHDVFPENLIPAHLLSSSQSLIYRMAKFFFDKAYRKADTLIVLGRDMEKVLKEKLGRNKNNTQIRIIENWADIDHIKIGQKNNRVFLQNPKIDIQYAGNIGRVQGLMSLLRIIKDIDNSDLRFSFWGEGAVKEQMKEFVYNHQMNNIIFESGFKREMQNDILNNCDLAIVTLADGMYGLGVPSKSYNIMAAGKPILFIGDIQSEIALTIRDNNIGYCFDSHDFNGLSCFFSQLKMESLGELRAMGEKARKVAETKYSETVILNKYVDIV